MTDPDAGGERSTRRRLLMLWAGLVVAPVAWALALSVNYALVPWLCRWERGSTLVAVVGVVTLGVAAGGVVFAWIGWRRSGRGWSAPRDTVADRSRFLSLVGLMLAVLLMLAIVAQTVPAFVIGPCT